VVITAIRRANVLRRTSDSDRAPLILLCADQCSVLDPAVSVDAYFNEALQEYSGNIMTCTLPVSGRHSSAPCALWLMCPVSSEWRRNASFWKLRSTSCKMVKDWGVGLLVPACTAIFKFINVKSFDVIN